MTTWTLYGHLLCSQLRFYIFLDFFNPCIFIDVKIAKRDVAPIFECSSKVFKECFLGNFMIIDRFIMTGFCEWYSQQDYPLKLSLIFPFLIFMLSFFYNFDLQNIYFDIASHLIYFKTTLTKKL